MEIKMLLLTPSSSPRELQAAPVPGARSVLRVSRGRQILLFITGHQSFDWLKCLECVTVPP